MSQLLVTQKFVSIFVVPVQHGFLCKAGQDLGVSQYIHWFNVYSTRGTGRSVFSGRAKNKASHNGKMSLLHVDSPFGFCGRKRKKVT